MTTTVINSTENTFTNLGATNCVGVGSQVNAFKASPVLSSTTILPVLPGASQTLIPKTEVFQPIDNQTDFILSYTPIMPDQFCVLDINGIRQSYGKDFTIVGTALHFIDDVYSLKFSTDKLQITYHIK